MLRAFVNAFKIPDLRKKILFTLFIIAVFRFGSHLPAPDINFNKLEQEFNQASNGGQSVLQFIDLFSGGALTRFAVFSLGIMPYITSSIIMQLLTVVIPRLEQWQRQGEIGIKKITQWTRYMTVTLALLQSTGLVFLFNNQFQVVKIFDAQHVAIIVLTLTAGTAMIMWLGELITQRGIGNGMSILIFTSVISRLPSEGLAILHQAGQARFYFFLMLGVAIIFAVVFMEQGQRRIPVQYAKRIVGRKQTSGGSTYIPLKVNQSGVIPIIFASSVLYFPTLLVSVYQATWFKNFVNNYITNSANVVYMVIYGTLVVFFAYFYTAIAFDPYRTGRRHPKVRRVHPGHPSGEPDRAVPVGRPEPHHAAGVAVPGLDRAAAVDLPVHLGHPGLPVRWDEHPHHRRRGAGDHETG